MKHLKRIALFLFIIIIAVIGVFIITKENNQVKIKIGKSEIYSEKDIMEAVDEVKKIFEKNEYGLKLKRLSYDEKESVKEAERQKVYNTSKYIITINSSFVSGPSNICGPFNPNELYTNYGWTFVRNSKSEKWKLLTNGEA